MKDIFELLCKIEKKEDPTPVCAIVAGLGNPGAKYQRTRHNAGFMAIDYIAKKNGVKIDRAKFSALIADCKLGDKRVILMKPETFMNNSGIAIAAASDFYKIPPESVIVIHDEISFDAGVFRIRRKGSAGGHNGLKSIIASLGSEGFPRIKVGVGKKPTPEYDLVDFVLGTLPVTDMQKIEERFEDIEASVKLILDGKIDEAMNKYSK
ncbi:MAG: aminoacyl-tRNA hydrolase [Clostridia bacterium]|nr:aminoacyl-tRNA hydrolase [Clostridia bacterium]